MAATPSKMLPLGTPLPRFTLPNAADGKPWSSDAAPKSPALLVMFICNHCPYVIHIRDVLFDRVKALQAQGLTAVAINSNSLRTHPQDGPVNMKALVEERGLTFPFLFDETQDVARAFQAACTPDFFLFGADRKLVYRGRFDAATPGRPEVKVTGDELCRAIEDTLAGRTPSPDQKASIGCNIKWN